MTSFARRFDAYYNNRCDKSCYLETKGYYADNGVTQLEPQDSTDLELEAGSGENERF